MINAAEECACRAMDRRTDSSRRALVIVAPSGSIREVRNMVAASLPVGSLCTGSVWRSPDGRTVEVLEYKDQVPVYDRPYDLELCNAGAALSPGESVDAQRWRGVS